jgi:hypothetical protein
VSVSPNDTPKKLLSTLGVALSDGCLRGRILEKLRINVCSNPPSALSSQGGMPTVVPARDVSQ